MYEFSDIRIRFFFVSSFPEINENIIKMCRNSGFEPKPRRRLITKPDVMADMGVGVTSTRDQYILNSKNVDLFGLKSCGHDFSIAWHKDNYNPAISQFYSLVEEVIKSEEAVT